MPYRKKVALTVGGTHPWIGEVVGGDECLRRILSEAAVAEYYAGSEIEAARQHVSERALHGAIVSFSSARKIMNRFEVGSYEPGWRSWKAAVDAVRKYVEARYEAVEAVGRASRSAKPSGYVVKDDRNRVVARTRSAPIAHRTTRKSGHGSSRVMKLH